MKVPPEELKDIFAEPAFVVKDGVVPGSFASNKVLMFPVPLSLPIDVILFVCVTEINEGSAKFVPPR